MKSTFTNGLLLILLFFASVITASAQQVIVSTGFNNYAGTVATAPPTWYMSWHSTGGTAGASYYTSVGNYGSSAPSYKLGIDQDSVISPPFSGADTVTFWLRGSGFTFSSSNVLSIYESPDSINWTLIDALDTLPTSAGATYKEPLSSGTTHVLFIYTKVSGNLAFDDVKIVHFVTGIPVCDFTSPGSCVGDSTYFTDASVINGGSISSWSWDFGDGTALSTDTNPSHLFAAADTFSVKLKVVDNTGDMDSITIPVMVYSLPVIHITSDHPTLGCASFCLHFYDSSTVASGTISGFSRQWDFGDGGTSGQRNPTHCFTNAGTYSISLTDVSTFGCSASDAVTNLVTVVPKPTADFTFTDSAGVFIFTNASSGATLYTWDFGDGSATSSLSDPSHVYLTDTIFDVCLIAATVDGCVDTICQSLQQTGIQHVSSNPDFSISPNPSKGKLTLTFKNANWNSQQIQLFDLIGNEIRDFGFNRISDHAASLNLSNHPEGFYFLRVNSEKGTSVKQVLITK